MNLRNIELQNRTNQITTTITTLEHISITAATTQQQASGLTTIITNKQLYLSNATLFLPLAVVATN